MKLVPYRMSPMHNTYSMMNGLIDDFFKSGFDDSYFDSFKVDVEKTADRYVVTADLPGVKKEDIAVDVEEGVLTIAIHKEENTEEADQEKNYLHRERRMMNTSRSVRLGDVDEEKIAASLQDGVLKIELPFAEEIQKKRAIEIQ